MHIDFGSHLLVEFQVSLFKTVVFLFNICLKIKEILKFLLKGHSL